MYDFVRFLAFMFVSFTACIFLHFGIADETWWLGSIAGLLIFFAYKIAKTGGS